MGPGCPVVANGNRLGYALSGRLSFMASLTLKNIPDELLQRLRSRAERERRSLTGEILHLLETAAPEPVDPRRFLEEVREVRQRYGLEAGMPERIDRWMREGRTGEEAPSPASREDFLAWRGRVEVGKGSVVKDVQQARKMRGLAKW